MTSLHGLPDPDTDPDLAHLIDLLAMLPGPTEDREFWNAVQAQTWPATPGTELEYIYEKMAAIWRVTRNRDPQTISYLAKYLLFFFSGDKPRLWKILNRVTSWDFSLRDDDAGRWWAQDVCDTAWALYVRYSHDGDDRWQEKWRYQDSWLEWLPNSDNLD